MLDPEYVDITKMMNKKDINPQIQAQLQLYSEEKPLKSYSFKEASVELDSLDFDT